MPTNLLIGYNHLLELLHLPEPQRYASLKGVFKRDFDEKSSTLKFRGKQVFPTPGEEDALTRLFRHLTTVVVDESTKRREFEAERSQRLHWVRVHILEEVQESCLTFWSEDPDGKRLYIFNENERYVIVLEPLQKSNGYYLLTAYRLEPRNMKKIKNKYKRRIRSEQV